LAYFSTASSPAAGPGKPRAIAWNGVGGCVIVSQERQLNFPAHARSRTIAADDVEGLGDILTDFDRFVPPQQGTSSVPDERFPAAANRWESCGASPGAA